jgi:hypothetical protein
MTGRTGEATPKNSNFDLIQTELDLTANKLQLLVKLTKLTLGHVQLKLTIAN